MTTVYLDPVGTAVADLEGSLPGPALPGAVEAVSRLCDARYDVIVLSDRPVPALGELDERLQYAEHPPMEADDRRSQPDPDSERPWMIASDRGWDAHHRVPGMRTIRVGPRRPSGRRTVTRFDLEARDLPAAVMEILVRDLMP